MVTEIGARDFGDPVRYNMLEVGQIKWFYTRNKQCFFVVRKGNKG